MAADDLIIAGGLAALALLLSKRVGQAPDGQLTREEVRRLANNVVARHYPAVDPVMLAAMAEIESSRRPAAFRWEPHLGDASVGLMQTLLSTARWLWNDLGARAFAQPGYASLADPEASVYFGAAYVNWLRNYGGQARSEQWIVESYNGGPGNSNSQTQNHWRKYQEAKASIGG